MAGVIKRDAWWWGKKLEAARARARDSGGDGV